MLNSNTPCPFRNFLSTNSPSNFAGPAAMTAPIVASAIIAKEWKYFFIRKASEHDLNQLNQGNRYYRNASIYGNPRERQNPMCVADAVIPTEVEGSRGEIFKATRRDPSTAKGFGAQDDRILRFSLALLIASIADGFSNAEVSPSFSPR